MWMERLLENRPRHALELAARFAEQRQRVLAENVANLDTPDYQTRRLDPAEFQAALREALDRGEKAGARRLELRGSAQVATDARGRLRVSPAAEPAPNVLFHDGTNARLDDLMAQAGANALLYEFSIARLRASFDGLLTAIRGRE